LTLKEIIEPIKEDLNIFQSRFKSSLKSKVALVDIITKYILKQKGKKIRPVLVILCAKLFAPSNERTYTAAILVELLHTATLIHDDVVDEAKMRRGIASVNAIWKNKAAVLIGDYLLSKGLLISLNNNEYEFLQTTSEAVRRMSEGELLQIQKARNFDSTEETYFKIISDKTASLIKTCCKLGALSTTNDKKNISAIEDFGENLGIAFQLRDDLLDYSGRKKLLGKATGNDLKEKKFTLPLIISLKNAPSKESREITKQIKSDSFKKFENVYHFVNKFGGMEYTQNKIIEYSLNAKKAINQLKDGEAKISLLGLSDFISSRNY
jgi:octaprenyl-diphosphate synthase